MEYNSLTVYPKKNAHFSNVSKSVLIYDTTNNQIRVFVGHYNFKKQEWKANGASFGYKEVRCWSYFPSPSIDKLKNYSYKEHITC